MYGYADGSLIGQHVSFTHPEEQIGAVWGRVVDEHEDGTVTVEYSPMDPVDGLRVVDEVRLSHYLVEVDSPW